MRNPKRYAYYCSREWGLKKEAVHRRSRGQCERCNKRPGQAVHHKTYARLYNEPLEDLWHLCNDCHDFVHGKGDVDHTIIKKKVYLAGSVFKDDERDWGKNGYGMGFTFVNRDGNEIEFDWEDEDCSIGGLINDWRKEIFPNVYDCLHKANSVQNASPIRCKRFLFSYVGPTISFMHGCDSHQELPHDCLMEVRKADLLFAWIDSEQTIGTIAEIGAAYTRYQEVCIGFKTPELQKRFYFVNRLARRSTVADSAKEAWEKIILAMEAEYAQYDIG